MARIPDAELERLKREVSLKRLIEAHGVTSRARARTWSAAVRCTRGTTTLAASSRPRRTSGTA